MKKTLTTVAATAVLSSSFVSYAAASTHKVESGDSLWTIAREYDTTVSNLKSWNKLQSEVIFPNQLLKVAAKGDSASVPAPPKKTESKSPSSTKTYTVKSGDTLGQIAITHSVSVAELSSWNGIKGYLIYPGQVLKVSKGSASSQAQTPAPKPSKSQPQGQTTYTVKSGDTLGKIALDYSVSVSDLSSWNGVKGHLIYPGQVLKVSKGNGQPAKPQPAAPAPAKPDTGSAQTYTVRSGDTLSHISIKYGVSVSELKSWNGLKNDFLQVGQVLTLKAGKKQPAAAPPKEQTPPSSASFSTAKLLSEATSHMGTPYVWGGSSAGGFDCSGFIYYVFKEAGAKDVKRLSSEGYYSRSYYVNTPQPGDLVFFENTYKKGISHLGIYVGNNEFIHAGDNGVEITSLNNSYWKSKFDGFKRFYEL